MCKVQNIITSQALMTPALLHKIDLRAYDDIFCEMVSLNMENICSKMKINTKIKSLFLCRF